ncbi:MAG TPA: hypothetical protein DFR83_09350 [Deltaproteobacteria bacterium]|nr:hypothetical protein [Deltaproteobacteria bacterium]
MHAAHSACLLIGICAACSNKDDNPTGTAGEADGTATSADTADAEADLRGNCPDGMVEIPPLQGELGEGDPILMEQYAGQQVVLHDFTLDGFCIDRHPFPGDGQPWPSDALDWDTVERWATMVGSYGRRLCTVAELMHAAAGPDNWRYPYDRFEFRDGLCEPGDLTPGAPIGTYDSCESPYGVRDFMVRSTWAVLDEQAGEDIRAFYYTDTGILIPGGGQYAVWGGSAQQGTFYAPNNYGLHFYGPGDPGYVNESVRACAPLGMPSPESASAYAAFVADFVASGEGFAGL